VTLNALLNHIGRGLNLARKIPHPVILYRIDEIKKHLKKDEHEIFSIISEKLVISPELTHDPEVALCLHSLMRSVGNPKLERHFLHVLAVQLDILSIDTLNETPVTTVRRFRDGIILTRRDATEELRITTHPLDINNNSTTASGIIFRQIHSDEFADIDLGDIWDENESPFDGKLNSVLLATKILHKSLDDLSKELFQCVISYILISSELSTGKRHSFNLRLAYPGAIFIDPARRPELLVAEDVLHEFIHQVLWTSWALNYKSFGDREWGEMIESPFTGNLRPLPVLAQALFIYNAAALFLQPHKKNLHWCPKCQARLIELENRLPMLLARIKDKNTSHPAITELVRIVENNYAFIN
jgi:hypothetical protein